MKTNEALLLEMREDAESTPTTTPETMESPVLSPRTPVRLTVDDIYAKWDCAVRVFARQQGTPEEFSNAATEIAGYLIDSRSLENVLSYLCTQNPGKMETMLGHKENMERRQLALREIDWSPGRSGHGGVHILDLSLSIVGTLNALRVPDVLPRSDEILMTMYSLWEKGAAGRETQLSPCLLDLYQQVKGRYEDLRSLDIPVEPATVPYPGFWGDMQICEIADRLGELRL